MKRIIFCLLIILTLSSSAVFAKEVLTPETEGETAFNDNLSRIWNFVLYRHGLSGYPIYNAKLNRYDFYDINNSYTGSLFYNALTDEWEAFKL